MTAIVLAVFIAVYAAMILGGIPGLALDRTGAALLGALALLAVGALDESEAWQAVDVPTILLLFGMMVVSSQFRLGGVYTELARRFSLLSWSPPALLAALIAGAGFLSAILTNDVVCIALAPLLVDACIRRRLDPVPFLLALACASNIGSAATLIGNPQNILIGQRLSMNFGGYTMLAIVPVVLSLAALWGILAMRARGRWEREMPVVPEALRLVPFDRWQSTKAVLVTVVLMVVILVLPWPRELVALGAAGVLLLSRKMASHEMLEEVDWHVLVLFIGLFIVNDAFARHGLLDDTFGWLRRSGIDLADPTTLFAVTVGLSNVVSNVPAAMLLLPAATHELSGPILALASTLAGNLLVVGSIANIIVVEQAARLGVRIGWLEHARVGVPVTAASLVIAGGWLWLFG